MNGFIALIVALHASLGLDADGTRKEFTLTPEGKWQQVDQTAPAPSAVSEQANPVLDQVEASLTARRFGDARDQALAWLLANPTSPDRDRGLLLMARSLVGTGDRVRAFYYCDELMDTYPQSDRFPEALKLQFDIANEYLAGAKDKLLGLRILGRKDEAVEMLFRIQQKSPGSPLADEALLRTADHYWAAGEFDLAADTYGFYAKTYPRSPITPQVRLREAYSNSAQFKGARYDPTPIINARTQMSELSIEYPEMAQKESLDSKVLQADRQLARRLYLTADFYRRTGKPKAAAHLCNRLIETYAALPEADDARKLLARLPK